MNEKLLVDWLCDNNSNRFKREYIVISEIVVDVSVIHFLELDESDEYVSQSHSVPLLDIIAWVWSQIRVVSDG